jgi:hypothetical protein
MAEYKIPGIYSSLEDKFAEKQSKMITRRYIMSLKKIIMGEDGATLKVNPDGTITVELSGVDENSGALPVTIAGAESGNGALDTNLKASEIIQPVDIQARYSQTIQTHNAVSVGASGSSASNWINCDGFDNVAVSLLNDASATNKVDVAWSHDGINQHTFETVCNTTSAKYNVGEVGIKAQYCKLVLINSDTASHTMSAWAYLKA